MIKIADTSFKEGRKKTGNKCDLKWKATINFSVYISYIEEEKFKSKIKVHKVHEIFHYNWIDVKVSSWNFSL